MCMCVCVRVPIVCARVCVCVCVCVCPWECSCACVRIRIDIVIRRRDNLAVNGTELACIYSDPPQVGMDELENQTIQMWRDSEKTVASLKSTLVQIDPMQR